MARISPPSTILKNTVIAEAFEIIGNKDCQASDLHQHLKKHKSKVFHNPKELTNDQGLNILHEMMEKGRLSMMIVVMVLGWWNVLSCHKVPDDSSSEHRGSTPIDIADKKRTRKHSEEVKHYSNWEKSLTPLMKSCRSGDIGKVKNYINNSIDPQEIFYVDENGWNALHWAVIGGNEEMITVLLDAGVDPSTKTKKKETLLHIACSFGKSHLIKKLLEDEKCKGDPNVDDISSKSPYDKVAESGDIDSLKKLVECHKQPNSTFLTLASFCGRQKCVEYCLEVLNLNINGTDVYDRTALYRACENKKEAIVKYLLKKGASLEQIATTGRNLLHVIAESGCAIILTLVAEILKKKKLLEKMINQRDRYNGVDLCFLIRGRDKGRDAWHYVEVKRSLVPVFLRKTKSGNVDVATFGDVIKSGWGVNPDQDNVTEMENMFKTRRLNKQAPRDMAPIHIACFKGHTDIVKQLLSYGANPNMKDNFQLTPLMIASSQGNLDIVKALETKGGLFDEVTGEGKTAVEIADINEQDDIVKYIKGMDFFQLSDNFARAQLAHYREELSRAKLEQVRSSGQDVKTHVVNILREMKIDINVCLQKLGSGPVLEATEE